MQVLSSVLRLLLLVTRPKTLVLGRIPDSKIYRSIDQYPNADNVDEILILKIDAPMYFANSSYLRKRYTLLVSTFSSITLDRKYMYPLITYSLSLTLTIGAYKYLIN